jgi:signal transduction histidine kinase
MTERRSGRGIGLVAMRERSELMGGQIQFSRPTEGGTLLHLTVPKEKAEAHAQAEPGKEDRHNEGQYERRNNDSK